MSCSVSLSEIKNLKELVGYAPAGFFYTEKNENVFFGVVLFFYFCVVNFNEFIDRQKDVQSRF
jgi:hypothetical protein